jgi:hypothetical protein
MASPPNIESSSNPDTVTGGSGTIGFGTIIAQAPNEVLGFYGNVGTVKATGTTGWTIAQVVAQLQAQGLFGTGGTAPTPGVYSDTLIAGAGSVGTVTPGGSYLPNIYDLVPLVGGTGHGATAMINVNGAGSVGTVANDLNVQVVYGGTGYTVGDVLTAVTQTPVFSTTGLGSGFQFVVSALQTNGAITVGAVASFGTIWSGINYVPGTYTGVALTNGYGTGCTATITVNGAGVVSAAVLVSGGSGYAAGDILSAAPSQLGVVSNNLGSGLRSGGFVVTVATIV